MTSSLTLMQKDANFGDRVGQNRRIAKHEQIRRRSDASWRVHIRPGRDSSRPETSRSGSDPWWQCLDPQQYACLQLQHFDHTSYEHSIQRRPNHRLSRKHVDRSCRLHQSQPTRHYREHRSKPRDQRSLNQKAHLHFPGLPRLPPVVPRPPPPVLRAHHPQPSPASHFSGNE